jgi:hypothetical protein
VKCSAEHSWVDGMMSAQMQRRLQLHCHLGHHAPCMMSHTSSPTRPTRSTELQPGKGFCPVTAAVLAGNAHHDTGWLAQQACSTHHSLTALQRPCFVVFWGCCLGRCTTLLAASSESLLADANISNDSHTAQLWVLQLMPMLPYPLCTCSGALRALFACIVLLIWMYDALRAPARKLCEQTRWQGPSTVGRLRSIDLAVYPVDG